MKLRDYLLKVVSLLDEKEGDVEIFTCLDEIECLQGVTKCKHWYDGEPMDERMGFEISFALIRKYKEAANQQKTEVK